MNKITKAQRDQIIAICLGVIAVVVGLYYGVIGGQKETITQLKAQTEKVRSKTSKANQLISKGPEIKENLDVRGKELAERESTMAPDRDVYAWMLGVIKPLLAKNRGVTIVMSQPEAVTDMNMLPHFYYKAVVFHIKGAGRFHDLGGFLADFENGFSYFRIQGLDLVPSGAAGSFGETESAASQKQGDGKLDFRFDIVVPVKPSDSASQTK